MSSVLLDTTSLVDEDEIQFRVTQQLNSIFRNDLKNLSKAEGLVEELSRKRDELEKRLRFATSEAPDKISRAVKAAEEALSQHKHLQKQCQELEEHYKAHSQEVGDIINVIQPDVLVLRKLQQIQAYQSWTSSINKISSDIEASLHINDEGQSLVFYGKLEDSVLLTQKSRCHNLHKFTQNMLLHWHRVLSERFKREYEALLKGLKWPFVSSNVTVRAAPMAPDILHRLEQLTQFLLQLSLPASVAKEVPQSGEDSENKAVPAVVADFHPPVVPLQLLLKPLEIRFMYHFTGNKATNSRENPEWYLTQTLKWISSHEDFLGSHIQPILNRSGCQNISAKVEFMRGLVRLVVLKLASDIPNVQDDDDLFCRIVQETLNFERELRLGFCYPSSQPSVLAVLTQAPNFSKWIHIERKFASELMDVLVSSDGAWQAVEGTETAHCGEQLILLLQGITDRYKPLPQPGHRLQFLYLQLELLEDFRVRILQMKNSELSDPLTSNYGAILNTVHYVILTLSDWADTPFFVEMQYYKEQLSHLQERNDDALYGRLTSKDSSHKGSAHSATLESSLLGTSANAPESLAKQDALESLNASKIVPSSAQLSEITGTVFDEILLLYTHIEKDMINTMAHHVISEVQARSQHYRKDKWFATSSLGMAKGMDGTEMLDISPSICPMLEVLTMHLLALRESLSSALFVQLWKSVASSLNKFFYEEVILQNRFSEAGAAQLKHDITHALFPVFGEYTQKPETLFPHVKESLILLTMSCPVAHLLWETLRAPSNNREAFRHCSSPVKALAEHHISFLTPKEALIIFDMRVDTANLKSF